MNHEQGSTITREAGSKKAENFNARAKKPKIETTRTCKGVPVAQKDIERFWSKVNKNGPLPPNKALGNCWLWTAPTLRGYGQFSIKYSYFRSHVFSFLMSGESLPDKMFVLHKCDIKGCVRPSHLIAGTPKQNGEDAKERGQQPFGSRHGMAILNESDVVEIRRRFETEVITKRKLSREYGISESTIGRIVFRKNWTRI